MRNRITAVGMELEGGWTTPPPDLHNDGSIRGLPADCVIGEISSPPIKTLEESEKWLMRHYPQHVHESCGFHIHVSMPPLHYSRLMHEDFNQKFLSEMENFWNSYRSQPGFDLFRHRLDGQNRFCQKIFRPEEQLWRMEPYGDVNSVPRYSQLNYCFGRHGTLECRLFPCFPRVEHSIEALRTFTKCINQFLGNCKPQKPLTFSLSKEDAESVRLPQRLATV